jgi:hypothetical protein
VEAYLVRHKVTWNTKLHTRSVLFDPAGVAGSRRIYSLCNFAILYFGKYSTIFSLHSQKLATKEICEIHSVAEWEGWHTTRGPC